MLEETYLRGGGSKEIDLARLAGVVAGIVLAALIGLAALLTVRAYRQQSDASLLSRHGVLVPLTVTGCEAIGSGIGMSTEYYDCRGDYSLAGHTYQNVLIGGSRVVRPVGSTVEVLAAPGHAGPVSVPGAAGGVRHGSYYLPAIICASAALVVAVLWWAAARFAKQLTRRQHDGQGREISPS